MNAWQWAALVVAIVAVQIAVACLVVAAFTGRFSEQAAFDADLEAVARGGGVVPGPPVELDPNYRSPAYDEPRRFGSGIA